MLALQRQKAANLAVAPRSPPVALQGGATLSSGSQTPPTREPFISAKATWSAVGWDGFKTAEQDRALGGDCWAQNSSHKSIFFTKTTKPRETLWCTATLAEVSLSLSFIVVVVLVGGECFFWCLELVPARGGGTRRASATRLIPRNSTRRPFTWLAPSSDQSASSPAPACS